MRKEEERSDDEEGIELNGAESDYEIQREAKTEWMNMELTLISRTRYLFQV